MFRTLFIEIMLRFSLNINDAKYFLLRKKSKSSVWTADPRVFVGVMDPRIYSINFISYTNFYEPRFTLSCHTKSPSLNCGNTKYRIPELFKYPAVIKHYPDLINNPHFSRIVCGTGQCGTYPKNPRTLGHNTELWRTAVSRLFSLLTADVRKFNLDRVGKLTKTITSCNFWCGEF